MTVTLDIPPAVATSVAIDVSPVTAGSAPATVSVAANELSASFTYTSNATATVTATLGASSSSSAVTSAASSAGLVISAVYGGGGNTGAPFTNDYIEVHNASTGPIDLAGKSVQYGSATGTTWQVTSLPAITLAAGGYVLIQEAAGATPSTALPTPDATGTINMSAANGKVALVDGTTALSGACPTGLLDLIGYGTANCAEGTAAPAGSNTTALLRGANGCADTDANSTDVAPGTPSPRNTASAPATCN
ncbi:MAG TPA: lamin tail domain-containing protein [Kofleriaceae bacterium]|nr:lamin tail domain-containing protein [Kofleriaceae bacterium]